MVTKEDIPEVAICHKCGGPMQVIDLSAQAQQLGVRVPKENSYVLECCGFEQTIDDPVEAQQILQLLLAYHAQTQGIMGTEHIQNGFRPDAD